MFDILAEAGEIERSGRRIIHMEIGDTGGLRNEKLIAALQNETRAAHLGYSPSAGIPGLRSYIAQQYTKEKGCEFSAEQVIISPANALISQIFTILTDPGEAILLPDPGFPTYQLSANFTQANIVYYKLHESRGWNPDAEEVVGLMRRKPTPRLIVINTPSNPLGVIHDRAALERIIHAARDLGVMIMLDETYKNLMYDPTKRHIGHIDGVIYLYSFSKDAAAPGLRLGCAVADKTITAKLSDMNSLTFSCSPSGLQHALLAYLENGGDFHKEICQEISRRIKIVDGILGGARGISYTVPDAAFYFYINISELDPDADTFARRLLHEEGVCVCPGTGFGPTGRRHVRLSIAMDEADMLEGCRTLVKFINAQGVCAAAG